MGVTGDALSETIVVLVLLALNFIPQRGMKLTNPALTLQPLTNPAKVTDQGLCYRNSDAWGWQNSHQSGVISITISLFSKIEKSSEVYKRNNNTPKTLPCGTPDTMFKQTNNNNLLEKDGGTKNCIYKD